MNNLVIIVRVIIMINLVIIFLIIINHHDYKCYDELLIFLYHKPRNFFSLHGFQGAEFKVGIMAPLPEKNWTYVKYPNKDSYI